MVGEKYQYKQNYGVNWDTLKSNQGISQDSAERLPKLFEVANKNLLGWQPYRQLRISAGNMSYFQIVLWFIGNFASKLKSGGYLSEEIQVTWSKKLKGLQCNGFTVILLPFLFLDPNEMIVSMLQLLVKQDNLSKCLSCPSKQQK